MEARMSNEPNELEKFIAQNKDFFDKYQRINEEVEEEMQAIAAYKAAHPETYDTEYQVEVTNRFIEDNPGTAYVEIKEVKKP